MHAHAHAHTHKHAHTARAYIQEKLAMDRRMVGVSKSLSWLLRHGAIEAGVAMDREGYVAVSEVLGLKQFKMVTLGDLLFVVENNSRKRFELNGEGAALRVRASQGHSKQVADRIDHATLLTLITPDRVPSACVHGTYAQAWKAIQREVCTHANTHTHTHTTRARAHTHTHAHTCTHTHTHTHTHTQTRRG